MGYVEAQLVAVGTRNLVYVWDYEYLSFDRKEHPIRIDLFDVEVDSFTVFWRKINQTFQFETIEIHLPSYRLLITLFTTRFASDCCSTIFQKLSN